MRNAAEIVREVGVDHVAMATEQQLSHLGHRLSGIAAGAIGILLEWEIGLEDRLQHKRCRCHADPIPQGRDAQGAKLAVRLRDIHAPDRSRSISLLPERKRQFAEPPLDPIRLDIRKVLAVYTRRTLVGAALGIGMRQDVGAADLVVQGVKAIPGFSLRFGMQRRLQLLNTLWS
jgi:hypothetical protein